jgi:hypothetical protein
MFLEQIYCTVMVGHKATLSQSPSELSENKQTDKHKHTNPQTHTQTHTHTHTHTLGPSILPLLEARAEGFFWNLPELGRRIRFDVLHGRETCPLEAHFQSKEKPEVTGNEIRRAGWLGDDRTASDADCSLYTCDSL